MEKFVETVLTHNETEKVMVFKEVNTSIASFTWKNMAGFLRFSVKFEDEEFIILIPSHHVLDADEKLVYNYSVTIERSGGSIDLVTDLIDEPLETLIGHVIGAILKSENILEFTKVFEDFTGKGFYKFEF